MVNIEGFIKRLEIILEYYGVNASSFADNIGVQRSSLSHLLSGRNKPSLDFILKILEVYPEVDLYWILNGKGSFPKLASKPSSNNAQATQITSCTPEPTIAPLFTEDSELIPDPKAAISTPSITNSTIETEIDKIVIFYKDGTFKSYRP